MLGPHAPGWLAQDASAQALADAVQAALAQAPEALQTALQATVAAHGFNHFSQAWDQLLSRFAPCERGPGADPHHADHNAKEPEVKP